MNKSKYPKNWNEISQRIRERAGQCCEFCGLPNYAIVVRQPKGSEYLRLDHDDGNGEVWVNQDGDYLVMFFDVFPVWFDYDMKRTKIVLTVAHLNHDTADNRDENLKALCQKCHLVYDKEYHVQNATQTRRRKRAKNVVNQPTLFDLTKA